MTLQTRKNQLADYLYFRDMRNQVLILQSFGLGDCIFAQGVAKKFIADGYDVIWPVKPWFVDGLRNAYPHVTWIPDTLVKPELFDIKEDRVIDNVRIFPMRWSDSIMGQPATSWMKTKFMLAGMDWKNWKKDAMPQRSYYREAALMYDEYKIERGERFNLINRMFRTDGSRQIEIVPENDLRNVEMAVLSDYSLFDHAMMIERAENIYVANSAIFYLLELLNLTAKEVHMYRRVPDEQAFEYVDYIMSKNYILHT